MKAEHRRPLIAFLLVTIACFGVMAHAIRTDALGGLGRLDPSRIVAGAMLVPKAPDAPAEAPLPVTSTPSEHTPSSTPSSTATRPPRAEHVRHDAGGHAAATQVVADGPQAPQPPASTPVPSTPGAPTSEPNPGQPSRGPEDHDTHSWPGSDGEHETAPGFEHGSGLGQGLHDLLEHVTNQGHDWGHGHAWGQGDDEDSRDDHDWGRGHDQGHDRGHDRGHDWGH
jgi:hypothetical protein